MPSIRLESGIAFVALALHAMFITYLSSLFYALSRPAQLGTVAAFPMQFALNGILLFALPGFVMAGIAYTMSKRQALRSVAKILIAQGILLPAGMFFVSSLTGNLAEVHKVADILTLPWIFLFAGFAPIALGVHLTRLKPVKRSAA